jgi:hypothetical protein
MALLIMGCLFHILAQYTLIMSTIHHHPTGFNVKIVGIVEAISHG